MRHVRRVRLAGTELLQSLRFPRASGSARVASTASSRAKAAPPTRACVLCARYRRHHTRVQPRPVEHRGGADGTHAHLCCAEPSEVAVTPSAAAVVDDAWLRAGAMAACAVSGRSGAVLDEELLPGFPSPVRARRGLERIPRSRGQPLTGGVLRRALPRRVRVRRRLPG